MNFDEYQKFAARTGVYRSGDPDYKLMIIALGLAGETGEVIEKVKHIVRDHNSVVSEEKKELLKKEIGDVLWYAAELSRESGLSFNDVAETNIKKLADRLARGVVQGEGDLR